MRVLAWPAGRLESDGSANYRLAYPAAALAAQGADMIVDAECAGPTVFWNAEWPGAEEGADPPPTARVVGVVRPDADVVVMQRPGRRWWADVIPHLQAHGVKVVVDVDDLFDGIDRRHVAHKAYQPRPGDIHSHSWVDVACEQADLVTTTTPALAARYGHGHGVVLPNLVPASYLRLIAPQRPDSFGWTGSTASHPGDLQVTAGAVGSVARQSGWGFHVVGTGERVAEFLRLPSPPSTTGWLPFADYPNAYATITVAVVPLADTAFNAGKSALKMCEAAALGIPVVASPTADNRRMNVAGVGLLASSPGQWRRRLGALAANPDMRDDLAGTGRQVMVEHTYEKHCGRWWDAWTEPLQARRAA